MQVLLLRAHVAQVRVCSFVGQPPPPDIVVPSPSLLLLLPSGRVLPHPSRTMFLPRPAGVPPSLCLRSCRGRQAGVGRSPREALHGASRDKSFFPTPLGVHLISVNIGCSACETCQVMKCHSNFGPKKSGTQEGHPRSGRKPAGTENAAHQHLVRLRPIPAR